MNFKFILVTLLFVNNNNPQFNNKSDQSLKNDAQSIKKLRFIERTGHRELFDEYMFKMAFLRSIKDYNVEHFIEDTKLFTSKIHRLPLSGFIVSLITKDKRVIPRPLKKSLWYKIDDQNRQSLNGICRDIEGNDYLLQTENNTAPEA